MIIMAMALPIPARIILRQGTLRPNTGDVLRKAEDGLRKRTPPDHWLNLPRRKCDFCGKSYKPTQPFKKGQKYGFCSRVHKDHFHSAGGAYTKAREGIAKAIAREVRLYVRCDVCRGRHTRKPCPRCDGKGKLHTQYGRELEEFIQQAVDDRIIGWKSEIATIKEEASRV